MGSGEGSDILAFFSNLSVVLRYPIFLTGNILSSFGLCHVHYECHGVETLDAVNFL